MSFGVPYAEVVDLIHRADDRFFEVLRCPKCGENIEQEIDHDSKPIHREYAVHYQLRHETGDIPVTVLGDGTSISRLDGGTVIIEPSRCDDEGENQ